MTNSISPSESIEAVIAAAACYNRALSSALLTLADDVALSNACTRNSYHLERLLSVTVPFVVTNAAVQRAFADCATGDIGTVDAVAEARSRLISDIGTALGSCRLADLNISSILLEFSRETLSLADVEPPLVKMTAAMTQLTRQSQVQLAAKA